MHVRFVMLVLLFLPSYSMEAASRPNILWITTEDMSPTLGCYGDAFARTPTLDKFSTESIRYTRAFATAPVCSPSRSCLITGMYATSLNTQHLRCQFPIPSEFKGFPNYLRQAGYFCSNNVKTDYNLANEAEFISETWDRSDAKAHWRQRAKGQPFFSVFNIMMTHQSRTSAWSWEQFENEVKPYLGKDERSDPAKVPVPPYYPNTELTRRTMARFYDCVAAMDKIVAGILKELEQDGLADNTIVFFFSDHGSGIPRHKRLLHDSGMRVPLMIRFPAKYQPLAPLPPGRATDRLVSFVDFAPTVLSLLGIPIPGQMQGAAFLGGQAVEAREYVFGARDRVDEAFDLARSVRDGRWLYIRNYMPHLSWHQPEAFSDQSEMRREITSLAAAGKLNANQMSYAGPSRPREELYDTLSDPHQLQNLAGSAGHQDILGRLRSAQQNWVRETHDVSFLTEQEVMSRVKETTPYEMARDQSRYPQGRIVAAAEMVGDPEALEKQVKLLQDRDSAVRYWAAMGLRAQGDRAVNASDNLWKRLNDNSASVRIEAAGALVALSRNKTALDVLVKELRSRHWNSRVHAARTLQLLGEKGRPALPAMRASLDEAKPLAAKNDGAMFVQFSLQAAIDALEPK